MSNREDAPRKRGFAALTEEQRREIGASGGRAAHRKGTAHRFSSDEARFAGQKGGRVAQQLGKAPKFTSETAREAGKRGGATVSRDREHMARIGRLGAAKRLRQVEAEKEVLASPGPQPRDLHDSSDDALAS